jgi:DNA-binding response OmpR family regulator
MERHILIIDDNPSDLAVAEAISTKLEIPSVCVDGAYNALDLIHEEKEEEQLEFSLIVLDLQMPHMGGLELLKRLKKTDSIKDVPVIIMSGRKADNDVSTAINLGAADYIVKPIDAFIFEEKLKKFMNQADNSWADFEIPEEEALSSAVILSSMQLVKLSEIGAELLTAKEYEEGDLIKFFSPVLGNEQIRGVVESCSPHQKDKSKFNIKLRFNGLQEKHRKKIRIACRDVWRKHFSKMAKEQ